MKNYFIIDVNVLVFKKGQLIEKNGFACEFLVQGNCKIPGCPSFSGGSSLDNSPRFSLLSWKFLFSFESILTFSPKKQCLLD